MRKIGTYILILGMTNIPFYTVANETLGSTNLKNIYIEASYTVTEGQKVAASIANSEIGGVWRLDDKISAHFSLGGNQLLNRPIFFKSHTSQKQFGLTKAYAQYQGVLFDIKAGLLPIGFGLYGKKERFELFGDSTLIYNQEIMGLRDIGLSIEASFNGYTTSLTIHNGEGFEDEDDRMFFTGRWEWTDQQFFTAGLSAQTGTTKPIATNGESTNVANFDGSLDAKWRVASLYLDWAPNNWIFRTETYYGTMVQEKVDTSLTGGSVELGYQLSPQSTILIRQDVIDPNIYTADDKISESTLIYDIHGQYKNSSLQFTFTKKHEESLDANDDYFSLIWKMTPISQE